MRALVALVALPAVAGVAACASEEIPRYGDPQRVGGGVGGSTSGTTASTSSVDCETDTSCAVSFKDDIFPVLDTKSFCAATPGCHGDGQGNLTLTAGDSDSYYTGLLALTLKDGTPNIVPCDPDGSKLLCNLQIADGDNPHGACGSKLMPLKKTNGPTLADLKNIEDWITCGAPNN